MILALSALCIAFPAGAGGLWLLLTQLPILTLGDSIRPDNEDDDLLDALQDYNAAIAPVLGGQTVAAFVRRRMIWSMVGVLLLLLSIGILAGSVMLFQKGVGS